MTVRITLSFTDRHHKFLASKVGESVFATQNVVVAVALEQMMQDEEERELALSCIADEIRSRWETQRAAFVDQQSAFAAARRTIDAARKA